MLGWILQLESVVWCFIILLDVQSSSKFKPVGCRFHENLLTPYSFLNKLPTKSIFKIDNKEHSKLNLFALGFNEVHEKIERVFGFSIYTERKFFMLNSFHSGMINVDLFHAEYQGRTRVDHGDLELLLCENLIVLDDHLVLIKNLNWCLLITQKWLIFLAYICNREIAIKELIPLQLVRF